ncbi:MAG: alkaline phosphatase family protein [Actinomycetota bacterium]
MTPPEGWLEAACELDPIIFERMMRGHYPERSPNLLWVPKTPNFFGGFVQTGHSGPWDYLQEVPLVFYGPGFIRPVGPVALDREVTVADIAPTLGDLLDFDFPTPDGSVLDEILVPAGNRAGRPKVIIVVVWDGGGTNVLEAWPGFWPELERLANQGASLEDATVGSSPSVTPATHTTMGTGVMPNRHGATSINMRLDGRVVNSFGGKVADRVEVPMLGDSYDLATGNEALIGMLAYKSWHLGMMSHGARWPGGDEDMAVFVDVEEKLGSTPGVYYAPRYANRIPGLQAAIDEIDLRDGKRDRTWLGNEILDSPRYRRDTPVWVLHQTKVIKSLMRREGFGADEIPDLFFTNYKQLDEAGHNWNMLNREVAEVLRDTDAQLKGLTRFLDEQVGKREWVIVVTADHGMQPDAQKSRGWPISMTEVVKDIAEHFGQEPEGFVDGTAAGIWLDAGVMESEGITRRDVADFIVRYRIGDNVVKGKEIPKQYRPRYDQPIFEAAFPEEAAERVRRCVTAG